MIEAPTDRGAEAGGLDDSLLASAVGFALTGERVEINSLDSLAQGLARAGFDAEKLARLRADRQAAQAPWPFAVAIDELRAVGFARFAAALADARTALGLDGLRPTKGVDRRLNEDEQRLVADRPPHW